MIENKEEIKQQIGINQYLLEIGIIEGAFTERGDQTHYFCPIHGGDHGQNFVVNNATNLWYCHTACQTGGDIFKLHAKLHNLDCNDDFERIVEEVAAIAGVEVKHTRAVKSDMHQHSIKSQPVKNEIKKIPQQRAVEVKKRTTRTPQLVIKTSKPLAQHAYFEKKRVEPCKGLYEGVDEKNNKSIIIPFYDAHDELKAVQFIHEKGKFFCNAGEDKKYSAREAYFTIGKFKDGDTILIGEGIATMLTCRMAFDEKVPAISYGASWNCQPVIKMLMKKYPNLKLIHILDNDKNETALKEACIFVNLPNISFREPSFEGLNYTIDGRGKGPTDFNDLISKCDQPLTKVKEQLNNEPPELRKKLMKKILAINEVLLPAQKESSQSSSLKEVSLDIPPYTLKNFQEDITATQEGLLTGYKDIDNILRIPTEALTFVLARPSHGKTTFMLNLILNMVEKYTDKTFIFFSYEETRKQIALKMIIRLSGYVFPDSYKNSLIYESYLKKGNNDNQSIEKGKKKFAEYADNGRLKIVATNYEVQELSKIIKNETSKHPIGALFIDYIQKIKNKNKFGTRQLELQDTSHEILEAAKTCKVSIISGAQATRNKNSKGDIPQLDEIRECGDIEQDANLVISLCNKSMEEDMEKYKGNIKNSSSTVLTTNPIKNRNGRSRVNLELTFDKPSLTITDNVMQDEKPKPTIPMPDNDEEREDVPQDYLSAARQPQKKAPLDDYSNMKQKQQKNTQKRPRKLSNTGNAMIDCINEALDE